MRTIYQECKLVHADFSEYNLLYFDNKVYVIDVGQAVEHDHPQAFTFLKRDCSNINDFYKRQGCDVLSTQALFEYITNINTLEPEAQWEQAWLWQQSLDDEVFQGIHIPRTLQEIEFDDDFDQELFKGHTGVCNDEDTEEEDDGTEPDVDKKPFGDILYQTMSKNERKQKVKEDKKEKRSNKMPKHLKRLKVRQSAAKHRNKR